MRQEFEIVKKLKKQFTTKNSFQNEKNGCSTQQIVSSIDDENLVLSKTENKQNKFDCSFTSCDCPRCRNMNGNYKLIIPTFNINFYT